MNYGKLKELLETLTEEQLQQRAIFFKDDEETGTEISGLEIAMEDTYFDQYGDALGNLEMAKEELGEDWESEKDSLIMVPAGTVILYNDF